MWRGHFAVLAEFFPALCSCGLYRIQQAEIIDILLASLIMRDFLSDCGYCDSTCTLVLLEDVQVCPYSFQKYIYHLEARKKITVGVLERHSGWHFFL